MEEWKEIMKEMHKNADYFIRKLKQQLLITNSLMYDFSEAKIVAKKERDGIIELTLEVMPKRTID